jgi:hypothetical protein
MTPYAHKLQYALIEAGKAVEAKQRLPTPTVPELQLLYEEYLVAVSSGDLRKQAKAVQELTAALVKWQVETL